MRVDILAAGILRSFKGIYIHQESRDSRLCNRVLSLAQPEQIQWVEGEPLSLGPMTAEEFDLSKKILYILPFRGQFFKRCPGATQKKTLSCCNYHVLNLGSQCNLNCSYCYLQSYLNSPTLKLYSNVDQALRELEEMHSAFSDKAFRIGTGEIMDSLSLDPVSLFSRDLISFFKDRPTWTLEFKSKSHHIDAFQDLGPAPNVVCSWSLNAQEIIEQEEHGASRLSERLRAAEICKQNGFSIAFHLDPLIWHPQWKENYSELVSEITSRFKPEEVSVISLGALRFQPEQRLMMKQRFGLNSWVTKAEMFPSEGNKLRYDRRLREEMFSFVRQEFIKNSPSWRIFLCMETPETWLNSFEHLPMQNPNLRDLFKGLPSDRFGAPSKIVETILEGAPK